MNTADMVDMKMCCIMKQLETIESGYVRVVCSAGVFDEPSI